MKPVFICDYDETIVASVEAFVKVYNMLYQDKPNFVPAYTEGIESYDLYKVCTLLDPLKRGADSIFGSKLFFEVVNYMNDNTYDALKKISETYDIFVCSIGVPANLGYKCFWLGDNLPFANILYIGSSVCKMDKSRANMKDCWFLDDVASNLFSSDAKYKACFGNFTSTNVAWVGKRVFDWSETCDWLGVKL